MSEQRPRELLPTPPPEKRKGNLGDTPRAPVPSTAAAAALRAGSSFTLGTPLRAPTGVESRARIPDRLSEQRPAELRPAPPLEKRKGNLGDTPSAPVPSTAAAAALRAGPSFALGTPLRAPAGVEGRARIHDCLSEQRPPELRPALPLKKRKGNLGDTPSAPVPSTAAAAALGAGSSFALALPLGRRRGSSVKLEYTTA